MGEYLVDDASRDITQILQRWHQGDEQALHDLMPLIYEDLCLRARSLMRRENERPTFSASDLVQEAFLKIQGQQAYDWQNRAHFFGVAAVIMNRFLINRAVRKGRVKHGGDVEFVCLDKLGELGIEDSEQELVMLGDALEHMQKDEPEMAQLVGLRWLIGFDLNEMVQITGIPLSTLKRRLRFAKAWLKDFIKIG